MNIAFANAKLKRDFNSTRRLSKKYGKKIAAKISERLTILEEAQNLADIHHGPPLYCHQLEHDRKGQYAIRLTESGRLTFEPDHDPLPILDDGGIDISKVTAIVIVEVIDYHTS